MKKDAKICRSQISMLVGRLVTFQENFSPLPFADGIWAIEHPKLVIALCIEAIQNRAREEVEVIIRMFSSVITLATIQASNLRFVVNDYFIANIRDNAKIKIAFLGKSFQLWFEGKIEPKFSGSIIEGRNLIRSVIGSVILAEFGGRKKIETTLREVCDLMGRQENGGRGDLLTNGAANIFFIGDVHNKLRVVRVRFYGDYWRVNSYPVNRPTKWQAGDRIFARQFIAPPLPLVA